MATLLRDYPIGSIIKINTAGYSNSTVGAVSSAQYRVIHKGSPSADYVGFDNGVLLLSERGIIGTAGGAWYAKGVQNSNYSSSNAYGLCSNVFANQLIDATFRPYIKQVRIPCRPGGSSSIIYSGSSGISCKAFLLSAAETGGMAANSTYISLDEGVKLDYFDDTSSLSEGGTNEKRAFNGDGWWLRSPNTKSGRESKALVCGRLGNYGDYTTDLAVTYYYRPAFVLDENLLVNDDGTLSVNTAPSAPGGITVPEVINGGVAFNVSWGASSDAENNLDGYKAEWSLNGGAWSQIFQANLTGATVTVPFGTSTVQFRVKAYDSAGLESAYATGAAKTVINNTAPTAPGSITVPANPQGGASLLIAWGASTDAQGDAIKYRLQRSVDGGAMATVYEGAEVHYTDTVTKGWLTVRYQVCAIDALGAASAYVVSSTRTVDNTSPPVIASGVSGDLGTKDDGFSWGYTVTQPDNTETTVTELIDGVVKRSYTASLGAQNAFEITRDAFKELLNGKHTMTVTAAAAGKSVSYSVTFTRATYTLRVTLPESLPANPAVPITKALVEVTRSIPADAAFKVLVTNNGLDANPVWEDATQSVLSGGKHLFSNTVLVNAPAFNFIVTASRGASNTGGSISAVAGAFE